MLKLKFSKEKEKKYKTYSHLDHIEVKTKDCRTGIDLYNRLKSKNKLTTLNLSPKDLFSDKEIIIRYPRKGVSNEEFIINEFKRKINEAFL